MSEFLWQNGARVDRLALDVSTDRLRSGFWLGDGLFETMLVSNGEIFARDRHLRRLDEAKKRLGFFGKELDVAQGLAAATSWIAGECGQIRLTYLSSEQVIITARKHEIPATELKLVHYPYPKNERSVLAGIKTLSYGENGAALRYAKEQSADDVIFTNTVGVVTESALANLLLWDGDTWWTPSLASGCLAGLTRELLMEFFEVKERDFTIDELFGMAALALASALRDVQPVSHFQGHSYSGLSAVARLREEFQDWRAKNPHP
jgi:branched-chain amino acid aminotransferase